MHTYETLKHTTWECKYHVVFIPKYRHQALYVQLRRDLGPVFRDLAEQKECTVEEGHLNRKQTSVSGEEGPQPDLS